MHKRYGVWCVLALGCGIATAQSGNPAATTPQGTAQSAPAAAQASEAQAGAPATDQAPAHPASEAQVREILDLTGAANLQKQVLGNMMPGIRQMMPPYMPASVMDDLAKELENADLITSTVQAYQRHLSAEDADTVIAFYKSPAGHRLITETPAIVQECQQNGEKVGEQVMLEVIERHRSEIEAAKAKYEQQEKESQTSPQN